MSTVCCTAKHTKFNPMGAQWTCPHCGANNGKFVIWNRDEEAHEDCEKLHVNDFCLCEACSYEAPGDKVAKALAKKANLVPCPCCKGSGMIAKDKADAMRAER